MSLVKKKYTVLKKGVKTMPFKPVILILKKIIFEALQKIVLKDVVCFSFAKDSCLLIRITLCGPRNKKFDFVVPCY